MTLSRCLSLLPPLFLCWAGVAPTAAAQVPTGHGVSPAPAPNHLVTPEGPSAPPSPSGQAPSVPPPSGIVVAPEGKAPEAPKGMRLPITQKALAQRVELSVVPASPSFEGTTELEMQLTEATDVIWLNVRWLTVQKASARIGETEIAARVSLSPERVALRFPQPLPEGRVTLWLAFTGVISSTEDSGVFHQKEGGDWYAMTQFEETDARRAFPCIDEPAAKIPWELTLRVPKELTAVSNTPIASVEPSGDGMKRVRFARTKPLPAYLVAFGVGPYDVVEARPAGVNKVPMHVYVPRGRAAEAAYAVRTSPELLETLERYFGLAYPYEKLDLLAIPLTVHFGAMENAGLVTVATHRLLARKEDESLTFERTWAVYAAHEFAHQWFGDLVTMAWWNDVWLNEAFATWMENKAVGIWAPSWAMQVLEVTDRSDAASADTLVTARSIRQPIESYDDIANAFDEITYQKGAAVIRMFETYLGDEKFRAGVKHYLRTHAYGTATAEDFLAAISQATGDDIAPAFETFLDQSGVPELSVQLSCPKGATPELQLSQERLLPVGTTAAGERSWQLPVCARWSSVGKEHRACTLMTSASATLALPGGPCPSWVLPNAEYAGYYRLNLKGNLLQTLVTRGRPALTTSETVGLLGDVSALVAAGRFPAGDGMELSTHFANAPSRRVVEEAIRLASVRRDFLDEAAAKAYPRWVRRHFGARARALGMRPHRGEGEDTQLLRPFLVRFVAEQGEDPELIQAARTATQHWLEDPTSVNPEMVSTVLSIAGTFGDAALHDKLLERLKTSSDRATRAHLVAALGAFRNPALVRANLALLQAAPVDARELTGILPSTLNWPLGHVTIGLLASTLYWPSSRELAFQAVSEHFELFASRLPERSAGNLFYVGSAFCDAEHRAAVEAAFTPRARTALGGKRELAQTLETVDLCIANRAVQVPTINAYLLHAAQ
ncbi:MAG: M1 family aminopeptidase [Myxococcaceae bacterium]